MNDLLILSHIQMGGGWFIVRHCKDILQRAVEIENALQLLRLIQDILSPVGSRRTDAPQIKGILQGNSAPHWEIYSPDDVPQIITFRDANSHG